MVGKPIGKIGKVVFIENNLFKSNLSQTTKNSITMKMPQMNILCHCFFHSLITGSLLSLKWSFNNLAAFKNLGMSG